MIIERIFPPQSVRYNKWHKSFSRLGEFLDAKGLIQLFAIWTLTVSGIVLQMGTTDRFVYWDWNGWLVGIIKLAFVTGLFFLVFKPKELWVAGKKRLNNNELVTHTLIAVLFLLIGWISSDSSLGGLLQIFPYSLSFLGVLLIYQFVIEFDVTKGEWFNVQWDKKIFFLLRSTLLIFISVLLGFYFNDPIISTASMVAIPFPLIALIWPSHVRHLQRARFYPLFIFAMFVCVRAPWFLFPLAGLFYTFRTVNYFRYGIVYPSFGVNLPENI